MEHIKQQDNILYTFIEKNQNIAKLKAKIAKLEADLETINTKTETVERLGLQDTVNYLAVQSNKINLERIVLSLKLNKLEREVLLFELDAALSD